MFVSLALILLASGCSDQLKTYPVQGKVLFEDGSPVHVGIVELKSKDFPIQARGSIEKDGSFTLTTYQPGDGAVAGKHACVVVQFVVTEGMTAHRPSTIGVVAPKFASYSTSGLLVDITTDGSNQIELRVDGIQKQQPKEGEDHAHPFETKHSTDD